MNTTLALVAELENYVEATQYENAEPLCQQAAAELRRLHAENEALRNALGQAVTAHEMGVLLSGKKTRQLRAAMKEANHG